MSEEQKYLEFGSSLVGFRGLDILEVGGCVTPDLVDPFRPKSWTSIDINPRRFEGKDDTSGFFSYRKMSVTDIDFPADSFDRIFSVNCFEHVDDMEKAFSEMYRVLKPGGMLFTIFGPIWSSPVGHHTWIEHKGVLYHFGEQVFPDWYHLTKNYDELSQFLNVKYDSEVAKKICDYVYKSSDLNRLTDGSFNKLIGESDFSECLIIKNRKGDKKIGSSRDMLNEIRKNYPDCQDPRVTEFLLVLSKENIGLVGYFKTYFGLLREGIKKLIKR